MTTSEETVSKFDTVKLLAALLLVIGGIVAHYYYAEYSVLYRFVGLLLAISAALFVVYQTALGKLGWAYLQDSRVELRRVIWPTRQQTIQMTLMIGILVVITSVFMWGLDWVIGSLVGWLLGLGG